MKMVFSSLHSYFALIISNFAFIGRHTNMKAKLKTDQHEGKMANRGNENTLMKDFHHFCRPFFLSLSVNTKPRRIGLR